MPYRGIAKGKTIELDEPLPYQDGQPVSVSIELLPAEQPSGSAEAIRRAMHEPPHVAPEDVDELEKTIEAGKLPVRYEGVFDEEKA